jgi:hypothetical protein
MEILQMEPLTKEASSKSKPQTLKDLLNITSLPESGFGPMHLEMPDGQTIDLSQLLLYPVNHSPQPETKKEKQTSDTSYPISSNLGESKGDSRVCESERPSADSIEWLYCRDQKYRPIKSGIKPLVDGIARGVVHSCDSVITPNASAEARTIRLKGYGNAIVAPVAEEFIRATMDVIDE